MKNTYSILVLLILLQTTFQSCEKNESYTDWQCMLDFNSAIEFPVFNGSFTLYYYGEENNIFETTVSRDSPILTIPMIRLPQGIINYSGSLATLLLDDDVAVTYLVTVVSAGNEKYVLAKSYYSSIQPDFNIHELWGMNETSPQLFTETIITNDLSLTSDSELQLVNVPCSVSEREYLKAGGSFTAGNDSGMIYHVIEHRIPEHVHIPPF